MKILRQLWTHLRNEHTEPWRLGAAVALGVYVGVLPIYGLHTPICLVLAVWFRLNKVSMLLASNISIPLIAPFLVTAGLWVGEFARFGIVRPFSVDEGRDFLATLAVLSGDLPDRYLSVLLGDALLGVPLALFFGGAIYQWARMRSSESFDQPSEPIQMANDEGAPPVR